jgi:hypothetical protein
MLEFFIAFMAGAAALIITSWLIAVRVTEWWLDE